MAHDTRCPGFSRFCRRRLREERARARFTTARRRVLSLARRILRGSALRHLRRGGCASAKTSGSGRALSIQHRNLRRVSLRAGARRRGDVGRDLRCIRKAGVLLERRRRADVRGRILEHARQDTRVRARGRRVRRRFEVVTSQPPRQRSSPSRAKRWAGGSTAVSIHVSTALCSSSQRRPCSSSHAAS